MDRLTNLMGSITESPATNPVYRFQEVRNAQSAVAPVMNGTSFTATLPAGPLGTQTVIAAISDAAGNVGVATNIFVSTAYTRGEYAGDAAGCVTQIVYRGPACRQERTLIWDSQYRLISVDTNGTTAEEYTYDPLGRRIATTTAGIVTRHLYDGPHVIADLNATGGLLRTYLHGPNIDELIAMVVTKDDEPRTTNTYYAVRDHQNTIWAWVDEAGAVVESYDYDAWGRVLGVYDGAGESLPRSAVGNRFLFQGREYSWATGLYQFRSRWYDPVTGRWLSNDPIGISGGLNQYVFCANNPVNITDPLGLWGIQFGDTNLGSGEPWMQFTNESWMDVSAGACSALDGLIPFADPFEYSYADECGNVDSAYKTSRHLGAFARDIYLGARIPNIGQWIKNPVLYEIGQTTVPTATYDVIKGMNAIEKGRYLLNAANGNYIKAAFGTAWGEVGATIGTGLTPGGYLFGLGAVEAVDYQTR